MKLRPEQAVVADMSAHGDNPFAFCQSPVQMLKPFNGNPAPDILFFCSGIEKELKPVFGKILQYPAGDLAAGGFGNILAQSKKQIVMNAPALPAQI